MRLRIGDIVQLKQSCGSSLKGEVFVVIDMDSTIIITKRILNDNQIKHRTPNNPDINNSLFTLLPKKTYDDIMIGKYELVSGVDGYYLRLKETKPLTNQFNIPPFDILSSIFKYIPVKYNNKYGFYYDGKIYYKYTKKCRSNRGKYDRYGDLISKPKIINQKSIVGIIQVTSDLVVKHFNIESLLNQCKFRVKDYRSSGKLFGYTEAKKAVVDQFVEISKIELQIKVKKSDKLENTVYVKVGDKNLRFLLDDIEIKYPNVNGWTEPKDRTIKLGSKVRAINHKRLRGIDKEIKTTVDHIKEINKKRYIGFIQDNKVIYQKMKYFRLV